MNGRLLCNAALLGLAIFWLPGTAPETECVGRSEVVRLTPGLSMQPSSGTASTTVTGTVHCTGPVDGHRPTGVITTRHFFRYGYLDPDTCSDVEMAGWVDYSIPTEAGVVVVRNHFTETVKPFSDPARAFMFEGDRFSGRAFIQSTEGDCVTTPLTAIEFGWVGHWHDGRDRTIQTRKSRH